MLPLCGVLCIEVTAYLYKSCHCMLDTFLFIEVLLSVKQKKIYYEIFQVIDAPGNGIPHTSNKGIVLKMLNQYEMNSTC